MVLVGLLMLGWLAIVMGPPPWGTSPVSVTLLLGWVGFAVAVLLAVSATLGVRTLPASIVQARVAAAAVIWTASLLFVLIAPPLMTIGSVERMPATPSATEEP